MNAIVILDAISFLVLLVALVVFVARFKKAYGWDIFWVACFILVLRLFRDVSNLLQWSGISSLLESFEDYPGLLEPLFWGFLFYAFIQGTIRQSLKAEQEKYQLLADSVSDVLWRADLNGIIKYISPSVIKQSGYSAEERMSKHIFSLLTPESRRQAQALMAEELAKQEQPGVNPDRSVHAIVEEVHKNQNIVWTDARVSILRDENGKATGMLGISRDITARVKAEQEREELETQLRQTQKMEALGVMAGGIAHDFNNILFGILGYSDLARDTVPEDHEAIVLLDQITIAGRRAADLVRQILTFARRTERKPQPLDLAPLVKEVSKLMHSVLPASIEIRPCLQIDHATINADPTEIHQVLMNLCTNAGHAMMDSGGVLAIGLENIEVDQYMAETHPDLAPGDYALLSVTDTGAGIPPEIQNRIFEPFFTTKKRGQGTGMGLSVIHGIVHEHGGIVTFYTEPGAGTTFKVYLPQVAPPRTRKAGLESPLPRGTERIVVVDDEPSLTDMLSLMLQSLGYSVTTFNSSAEALAAILAQPDKCELLITDQAMPELTGYELSQALLKVRPDLPIIISTGFGHSLSEEKALAAGIKAFALKPLMTRDIARLIRQVLEQSAG